MVLIIHPLCLREKGSNKHVYSFLLRDAQNLIFNNMWEGRHDENQKAVLNFFVHGILLFDPQGKSLIVKNPMVSTYGALHFKKGDNIENIWRGMYSNSACRDTLEVPVSSNSSEKKTGIIEYGDPDDFLLKGHPYIATYKKIVGT